MHALRVGSLYHTARTSWPEAVQYTYRGGQHELLLLWPAPSASEVLGVAGGGCEFALLVEQPVIWLLYRFEGACRWSDAPFTIHLVAERERVLPPGEDLLRSEARALLTVVLVDASTGIVLALRGVSWSPAFTAAIHGSMLEQAVAPWDKRAYERALRAGEARWPETEAMLAAARERCVGGS